MFSNPLKRKQTNFQQGRKSPNGTESSNFKQPKISGEIKEIVEQRKLLPIFSGREKFIQEAKQHDSIILVGETGSGKTTQIPQYLFEHGLHRRNNNKGAFRIAITQPRRVAAVTLSKRVNEEMAASRNSPIFSKNIGNRKTDEPCDTQVGYKVRFEDSTDPEKTIMIFQTDGMLLREAMLDPLLSRYSWIILDEAHERKIETDILFGVIKNALVRRRQTWNEFQATEDKSVTENPLPILKVIVMSATLKADTFSTYFKNAPILHVLGRQHPVNIRHVTKSQDDWQSAIIATILKIHEQAPEKEDILVFMTGQEEIESMARDVRLIANDSSSAGGQISLLLQNNSATYQSQRKLHVLTLYAAQQMSTMEKIMSTTNNNKRKVILSTNIAETSLTIPRVKHVIDSCRVKAKSHQASTGLDLLKVVRISQAQAMQRTGRAGRESEGHCYRMLTRSEFDRLPEETTPEIKRCNLNSVILQMISIGVQDLFKFDFLDPPPQDAIKGALRQLILLGAIEYSDEDTSVEEKYIGRSFRLTDIGKKMAAFPLDPRYSKAILSAVDYGCTEEVITIVSMLSGDAILLTPSSKREEAISSRKHLISSEGDHITYLKIFRAYKQSNNLTEFCMRNFLHQQHMKFAVEVRKQIMELCKRIDIKIQSCGSQTTYESVRMALSRGFFTNVAKLTREGHYITLDFRQKVSIHPSSVMFSTKPEVLIYNELIVTQKSYIRDLSLVDANWLLKDQPDYFQLHRGHIFAPETSQ